MQFHYLITLEFDSNRVEQTFAVFNEPFNSTLREHFIKRVSDKAGTTGLEDDWIIIDIVFLGQI